MRRLLALVAALFLLGSPLASAQAHGGSYDLKYIDGSNVLLLTFNTHAPVSGLDVEHNLRLYDLLGAPIAYDEVAVEVHTRGDDQGLALRGQTLLHEETVPMLATNESKLTYAYPLPGSYSVRVVFRAGGRDISRGEFALVVDRGSSGPAGGFPWVRLGLALVLGLFVGTLVPSRPEWRRGRPGRPDPGDFVDPRDVEQQELSTAGAGRASS